MNQIDFREKYLGEGNKKAFSLPHKEDFTQKAAHNIKYRN
jgi:hypothetical protein